MKKTTLILSCEHASAEIPVHFQHLFNNPATTRNPFDHFDPFAKELTLTLAAHMNCPYVLGNISRMLVDLNKPLAQAHCFHATHRAALSNADKQLLLEQYVYPYRQQIETQIEQCIQQNQQVLHLSIHSFSPQERGIEHHAAIGLLYDSQRSGEKEVLRIWHELLLKRTPYTIRINYPRSGRADNYTSDLRKRFTQEDYLGIELEVNAQVLADKDTVAAVHDDLKSSIYSLLELI